MNGTGLIWLGMFLGGTVGGLVPALWGGGLIADTVVSGIGGLLGIWAGFRLGKATGAL